MLISDASSGEGAARKIGTGQIRFFATVDKNKMKGLEALENCLLAKRGGGGKAALAMDGDGEKNEDECQ